MASIAVMVALDAAYPTAVPTVPAVASRAGDEGDVILSGVAVGVLAVLVMFQPPPLAVLARISPPAAP